MSSGTADPGIKAGATAPDARERRDTGPQGGGRRHGAARQEEEGHCRRRRHGTETQRGGHGAQGEEKDEARHGKRRLGRALSRLFLLKPALTSTTAAAVGSCLASLQGVSLEPLFLFCPLLIA